jgi:lysophospholipase L1-like esterase
MRFGALGLSVSLSAALVILGLGAAAQAAPKENWIGAWGFVPIPLPPGLTPTTPIATPASPLSADIPPPTAAETSSAPLIDNPGQVSVASAPDGGLTNVTIRQIVRVSVAGKRLRLRFSNEGGSDALPLGAVHVGAAGPDGAVLPGSDHVVTFDGHGSVAIPDGAPLLSDAVAMKVDALQKLVVSIYVPGAVTRGGYHNLYQYVAGAHGEQTGAAQFQNQKLMALTALVSRVEVEPVTPSNVVVTLGDSITEGAQSTFNAFHGWPDRLADRLAAAHSNWSVVNAGIGGNRLLRYGRAPSALARLDRDVLSVPGIKAIILLEGINDISHGFYPPTEPVTLATLIAADRQIIARAHEHGIRVIGATLTPDKGARASTPKGEAVREGLNQWIKTGGEFDGVIDFAPSVADPADPLAIRLGFNLADHLHPNDIGYQSMANAIDLGVITGR